MGVFALPKDNVTGSRFRVIEGRSEKSAKPVTFARATANIWQNNEMQRELDFAELMRAANRADAGAYRQLLTLLAPYLRGIARRGLLRAGRADADCEDIVQETMLAVHLKRETWDEALPFLPWLHAIAHYKLVDILRRQGFREYVPLDICDELPAPDGDAEIENATDAGELLSRLKGRQREIVVGMAIEGRSAREVGEKLGMADGAVRVALHRALKTLSVIVNKGAL